MTWHAETLSRTQERVLARLGPLLTEHGFYLAGGTAVALHLGHRRSVDLDWFTAGRLDDPLELARELREGLRFVTGQAAAQTLHGSVAGVNISLFEYRTRCCGRCTPGGRADVGWRPVPTSAP